ncbi:hypothetical protein [Cupriavidus sp. AcVe19-6a]|uniref:hypothetical protein n=1 Tax=Cupriavidus sp. AcVe19-6a TaxID=2821358 RepID=UPI001AEA7C31|nr:hypothetical protein [Cupriavidus sp. AcVe19-6a]MBP0639338.1 hypothetical protein [Cupriavidus sp. AcVe19-6a]
MSKQILVAGAGFAGMWSTPGAARLLDEVGRTDVKIVLWLSDDDLLPARAKHGPLLGPQRGSQPSEQRPDSLQPNYAHLQRTANK